MANYPLIPLHPRVTSHDVAHMEVVVEETFSIAATSEIEIMGTVNQSREGTWVVEDRPTKKPSILVARALVTPHQGRVPMRVLNISIEPLTIYRGTRIATAKLMNGDPKAICAFSDDEPSQQSDDGVIEELIQTISGDLTDAQNEQMAVLRTQYAHIFSHNSTELGHTKLLSHLIETSGAMITSLKVAPLFHSLAVFE